ncbi:DUF1173 family protein [Cupriavidus consociatus]|uniref:DUF1173 family protein n=1 Tax=Cupriavidus consociatus TaxID=2821357 RepID=UPI001FD80A5A|nr:MULTISPECIES: DUF1173 family protein [unclassified Cupriavidus]MDK2661483.1 DUF1173 family protein [Cupriavidus sp. LEh21]
MITVRIGGNEFPLDDVLEDPGRYARHLERAKTVQGFAECGCSTRRPRPKLVIRRHRDIFLLVRWPEQAHHHAAGCPFNRQALAKSGASGNLDPFRMKDGHHDIRLDASLSVSAHTPAKTVQRAPKGQSTMPQRRSAGLLAFLEYAWEQAGAERMAGNGFARLERLLVTADNGAGRMPNQRKAGRWAAARHATVGPEPQHGDPGGVRSMAGQAHVHSGRQPARHRDRPNRIPRHDPVRWQVRAAPKYPALLHGRRPLRAPAGVVRGALSGIGKAEQRCVAVLLVERSKSGYLTVVDAAAMLANRQFVPCEVAMADYLVGLQRAFRKPLRHIGRAAMHPDFVLTDVAPEVVIGLAPTLE